jgi:predicted RNA-binding Zn-ribbon protein involved in translation (DUF1610 family)
MTTGDPKSFDSKPMKKHERPYCPHCRVFYGKGAVGFVFKCAKCGRSLILKSANPHLRTLGGILILVFASMTLLLAQSPIIWIGGFIWGVGLLANGVKQHNSLKKLDEVRYY